MTGWRPAMLAVLGVVALAPRVVWGRPPEEGSSHDDIASGDGGLRIPGSPMDGGSLPDAASASPDAAGASLDSSLSAPALSSGDPAASTGSPAGDAAPPAVQSALNGTEGAESPPVESLEPGVPSATGSTGEASGSLRAGYWRANRKLQDRASFATLALWVRSTPRLGSKASIAVEGWVRNEDLLRSAAPQGLLRELYLDVSLGPIDFRLGKQIVVWGRADGINPTDNISPRDLTLLVPDDADQRSGTYAARGRYFLGDVSLAAWWLPGFFPNVIPIPALPPPLVRTEALPSAVDSLGQGAFKLEETGGRIDWSLSYFDGYDRSPDLGAEAVSPTEVDVLLRHHRVRVAGGDFAANVGRFGLRGEAAFTFTQGWTGRDLETKKPFFFAVLGVDRTIGEYLNVNAQYLVRVVTNYDSPFDVSDPLTRELAITQAIVNGQADRVQQGGTFRVADKWFNETLEADLSGVFFVPRFNWAIRGKGAYALSDRWKVVVGFDYFEGATPSFFQVLQKNSTVFTELRLSF